MMLKKDNDSLREGLSHVLNGGDPSALKNQLNNNNDLWGSIGKASSNNTQFKSPKLNEYLFDQDNMDENEFQKFDHDKTVHTEKPLRKHKEDLINEIPTRDDR